MSYTPKRKYKCDGCEAAFVASDKRRADLGRALAEAYKPFDDVREKAIAPLRTMWAKLDDEEIRRGEIAVHLHQLEHKNKSRAKRRRR